MRKDLFSESAKEVVSCQSYSPQKKIEGIRFYEPKTFQDDGGFFLEIQRISESANLQDFPELPPLRQVNYSEIMPEVIKAWHVHPEQDEVWFIPPTQRLLVGLADVRNGSVSEGVTMRFVMGSGRAQLLFIPHGVAHGLANPWRNPAHMMYFVSHQFDANPETTQEYRLPWDHFGSDFWEVQKG